MYYIISEDGRIVEHLTRLDTTVLQRVANEIGQAVWVLEGNHSGITVEPEPVAVNREPDFDD